MQAHTSRPPGTVQTDGLHGQHQHSTAGRPTAAAGPEQLDQHSAPNQAAFSHASVVNPDSSAEQPAEAALPQPSSVPAGVFHFGCKRPVQISKAALSVGRKLAEKGHWGLVRIADLAASASTPDLYHAEGPQGNSLQAEGPAQNQTGRQSLSRTERESSKTEDAAGNMGELEQVTHQQNRPAPEAACFAHSVLAASLQEEVAEPDPSGQHVAIGGSMPGQASGSLGNLASLCQSDLAPGSPDHSACPEPGAFLGSAGIAMSSWGESQLLALPSLAQHREDDQQYAAEADLPVQIPQVILASPPGRAMQIYGLLLLSTLYLLQDLDRCRCHTQSSVLCCALLSGQCG